MNEKTGIDEEMLAAINLPTKAAFDILTVFVSFLVKKDVLSDQDVEEFIVGLEKHVESDDPDRDVYLLLIRRMRQRLLGY